MKSKSLDQRWDVKRGVSIFSCLRFGDIKRLITKGMIKEDDLIWHAGMSGWRRAGDQEELKPFFEETKRDGIL